MIAQFFGGIFNLKEDFTGPFDESGARFSEDGLASESVEKLVANLAF